MLRLGEKQRLTIIKTETFGVYLAEFMPKKEDDPAKIEKVLLPAKQVPTDFGVGLYTSGLFFIREKQILFQPPGKKGSDFGDLRHL